MIPKPDLNDIVDFIEYFSKKYAKKYKKTDEKYDRNISGKKLTPKNIRKLLEWKGSRRPYDVIMPKIEKKVVMDRINDFRIKTNPSDAEIVEFGEFIIDEEIYESGSVMRAFLIHCANPAKIPILDELALKTYDILYGTEFSRYVKKTSFLKKYYLKYRKNVLKLARKTGFTIRKIDRAFWYYGKYH